MIRVFSPNDKTFTSNGDAVIRAQMRIVWRGAGGQLGDSMKEEPKRWKDVFRYGFGYTACPYCGDETGWYNPASQRFQSDLENNRREHCPKCGKRVYARKGWLVNQPS